MSNPRIHVDAALNPGSTVTLSRAASHHLSTVLRSKVGDSLIAFNGDGFDYKASITASGKLVTINISESRRNPSESALAIHLVQGVSRGDRMDSTIQKAVELGVHKITPLVVSKSQVKLNAGRMEKKMSHWRAIIVGACEQCQRSVLPRLDQPVSLTRFLSDHAGDANAPGFVLDPLSPARIGQVELGAEQCVILTGPESGLAETEIGQCLDAGYIGLSLGPRVLRTETAGPAAIAVLQARFGDLR